MEPIDRIDALAEETAFSGVVRIDRPTGQPVERAYGLADRRWSIPMQGATAMSTASGTKGFTALVVMALVEAGTLALDTSARSLLGDDLPLIDDRVTVGHLLAHRSGIGDYLDEEQLHDIADHVVPIPVHRLVDVDDYVPILHGHPQVSVPGERFAYNNSGYVVLSILARRAAGRPFAALVDELVCQPAGLTATAFHRCDALPPGVATGYLHPDRTPGAGAADRDRLLTNSLHLPLMGSGDGGLFSTAADMRRFWIALFGGRIVSKPTVAEMTRPHTTQAETGEPFGYGQGFWLAASGPVVRLEGYDAGVSFASWHDPTTGATHTVLSNTSEGAWPIVRALEDG